MDKLIKCKKCYGSGFVLTKDYGIAGTEEYGTCAICGGTGEVSNDYLKHLEDRVERLENKHRD